jgi:uncharacterized coiled-coil DUF342 family protein
MLNAERGLRRVPRKRYASACHDPAMDEESETRSEAGSTLSEAYENRTRQLHEARGALAEAVAALTTELGRRRTEMDVLAAEASAVRDERDRAVTDNQALRAEVEAQRSRIADLEAGLEQVRDQLAAVQNMKVVRWTGPPRRLVYRLRARGE